MWFWLGHGFFCIGVAHSGLARCGSGPLVLWSPGPLVPLPLVLWSSGPLGPLVSWSAGLWLRLLEGYEYGKKQHLELLKG